MHALGRIRVGAVDNDGGEWHVTSKHGGDLTTCARIDRGTRPRVQIVVEGNETSMVEVSTAFLQHGGGIPPVDEFPIRPEVWKNGAELFEAILVILE